VRHGSLSVKDITSAVNQDRSDNNKVSPQRIGKTVKSLGITTSRTTPTGGSAILWDEDQLARLKTKYGLEEPSETSESASQTEEDKGITEVSEETEGYEIPF
jgi:hypothetical protein